MNEAGWLADCQPSIMKFCKLISSFALLKKAGGGGRNDDCHEGLRLLE